MLLREIKNIFHQELDVLYGKEEVSSFFYLLIEHYFYLQRFILAIQPDLVIDKEQETQIFKALADLKLEKPVQYITGNATFMELDFKVNEHVLIPRPETEELVRWILDDVKTRKEPLTVLDMGTGSGCIPISLAKYLEQVEVQALDISKEALEVARENAKTHGAQVDFFQADILNLDFSSEKGRSKSLKATYDIIVSNPPYVRELEKKEMRNNVLKNEPNIALFVPDEDPLKFYRAIVNFASERLNAKGVLYLEINQYLGKEMMHLLAASHFEPIELRKDMFGNDRMLKGIKS
ncbi:peptide chain release factor N(5)-glutamine methyltransferase [Maribacter sp. X9]|uniref:peptide chain release factor N(5)-glutamine methyltransferase n=1 Tax=Maribacter sp. X9 TaxID=3402159 RepID=UPI003AF3458E